MVSAVQLLTNLPVRAVCVRRIAVINEDLQRQIILDEEIVDLVKRGAWVESELNDPTHADKHHEIDQLVKYDQYSVTLSAYLMLLRVTTSNTTANTSIRPLTTYWRAMSVPMRFMPLVSDI